MTPLVTLFVVVPTVLAVLAAVDVRPLRRLPLPVAVSVVTAASFLGDVGFLLIREGWTEARWALPWMPFELAALLVLSARVVRRAPVRPAVVLGVLSGAAAVVLPLRFSLRESCGRAGAVGPRSPVRRPAGAGGGGHRAAAGAPRTGAGPRRSTGPGVSSASKSPAICTTLWRTR